MAQETKQDQGGESSDIVLQDEFLSRWQRLGLGSTTSYIVSHDSIIEANKPPVKQSRNVLQTC